MTPLTAYAIIYGACGLTWGAFCAFHAAVGNSRDERKLMARLVFLAPVWAPALAFVVVRSIARAGKYIWTTADLPAPQLPRRLLGGPAQPAQGQLSHPAGRPDVEAE